MALLFRPETYSLYLKDFTCRRSSVLCRYYSTSDGGKTTSSTASSISTGNVDKSASSKLWEDAAREDAEEIDLEARNRRANLLASQNQNKHENWTGEESVRDAVLRMLMDKYKPLRGPAIRTAEEKLHNDPPNILQGSSAGYLHTFEASGPILPGVEGHRPWHTTFKPPSHSVNVKLGNIPAPSSLSPRRPSTFDESDKKVDRSAKRRSEQAQRLGRARESLIDYRMGIGKPGNSTPQQQQPRRPPTTMKGWASLVEERIERARSEGQFRSLRGRGKPFVKETEESNPFIEREEFLMNRIIQRNRAAPPWVEFQSELETGVAAFRSTLRDSWTRRAIRMLTLNNHPSKLTSLTLQEIQCLRDTEWELRERSYHTTALEEVNSLVRRYNGIAPYSVRRAYHSLEPELERAYKDSAETILNGITARMKTRQNGATGYHYDDDGEGGEGFPISVSTTEDQNRMRFWDIVRRWFSHGN